MSTTTQIQPAPVAEGDPPPRPVKSSTLEQFDKLGPPGQRDSSSSPKSPQTVGPEVAAGKAPEPSAPPASAGTPSSPPVPKATDSGSPLDSSAGSVNPFDDLRKFAATPGDPAAPEPDLTLEDIEIPPQPEAGKWSEAVKGLNAKYRQQFGGKIKELEGQVQTLQAKATAADSSGMKAQLEAITAERDRLDGELAKVSFRRTHKYQVTIETPAQAEITRIRQLLPAESAGMADELAKLWDNGGLSSGGLAAVEKMLGQVKAGDLTKAAVTSSLVKLLDLSAAKDAALETAPKTLRDAQAANGAELVSLEAQAFGKAMTRFDSAFAGALTQALQIPGFNNEVFLGRADSRLKAMTQGGDGRDPVGALAEAVVFGLVAHTMLEEADRDRSRLAAELAQFKRADNLPGSDGTGEAKAYKGPKAGRTLEALDALLGR